MVSDANVITIGCLDIFRARLLPRLQQAVGKRLDVRRPSNGLVKRANRKAEIREKDWKTLLVTGKVPPRSAGFALGDPASWVEAVGRGSDYLLHGETTSTKVLV